MTDQTKHRIRTFHILQEAYAGYIELVKEKVRGLSKEEKKAYYKYIKKLFLDDVLAKQPEYAGNECELILCEQQDYSELVKHEKITLNEAIGVLIGLGGGNWDMVCRIIDNMTKFYDMRTKINNTKDLSDENKSVLLEKYCIEHEIMYTDTLYKILVDTKADIADTLKRHFCDEYISLFELLMFAKKREYIIPRELLPLLDAATHEQAKAKDDTLTPAMPEGEVIAIWQSYIDGYKGVKSKGNRYTKYQGIYCALLRYQGYSNAQVADMASMEERHIVKWEAKGHRDAALVDLPPLPKTK